MQEIIQSNRAVWFDPMLFDGPIERAFNVDYWQEKNAILGSAQGRGTTWFIQGPHCDMALRHYHRGGLLGKIITDSYWFSGWHKTRCFQEMQLLQLLVNGGVNVPRPIAAKAVKSGLVYTADILVEKINDSQDLVALLKGQVVSLELWREIGRMIRKMHDLQVCHTDLNAHNILLAQCQHVWLIDFDKCHQQSGNDWKQGNLDRLKRSFLKEVGREKIHWNESDWQVLCQGYDTAP